MSDLSETQVRQSKFSCRPCRTLGPSVAPSEGSAVGEYECAEAYASWVISRRLAESLKSHPETPVVMRLPLSTRVEKSAMEAADRRCKLGLPRTPRVTLRKKVPGKYGGVWLVAVDLVVVIPRVN